MKQCKERQKGQRLLGKRDRHHICTDGEKGGGGIGGNKVIEIKSYKFAFVSRLFMIAHK